MTAAVGRELVIKVEGRALAALKTKGLDISWEEIDNSKDEADGFRHLLHVDTVKSVTVNVEGVCTAENWAELLALFFANEFATLEVTTPWGQSMAPGDGAWLQTLSYTASHENFVAFSAVLLLSGNVLLDNPATDGAGGGGGGGIISLDNHDSVAAFSSGETVAACSVHFGLGDPFGLGVMAFAVGFNDGPTVFTVDSVDYSVETVAEFPGEWGSGDLDPAQWEILVSLQSGDPPTLLTSPLALGVWTSMDPSLYAGTDIAMEWADEGDGVLDFTAVILVQIRRASNSIVAQSAFFTMQASSGN